MWKLHKSKLFQRMRIEFARDYAKRAGVKTAHRFADEVEECLRFIQSSPLLCSVYDVGEDSEDLSSFQYRKWQLNKFPHIVIFRIQESQTLLVEAIYAQKMDIQKRLPEERDKN